MKSLLFLSTILCQIHFICYAQDTFSIVAVDPETGEVGSAGASCVDLYQVNQSRDDFLGVLLPGVGAINTQAQYEPKNQNNATKQMQNNKTPKEIINWLVKNDMSSRPQVRQYGVAAIVDKKPETAAHTGSATDNYKNHILGFNYAIQGNILKGKEVLEGIEQGFLNAKGDLACKLMGALQGANMVGADSRCKRNGTSSLFAYLKVAKKDDAFGKPSFLVSVRTRNGDRKEPIEALQKKFDAEKDCKIMATDNHAIFDTLFNLYTQNNSKIIIERLFNSKTPNNITVRTIHGNTVLQKNTTSKTIVLDLSTFSNGVYIISIKHNNKNFIKRVIK